MLMREGRKQGVKHLVFTHPLDLPIYASVEQLQEAAKLGAFIELDFRNTLKDERWRAIREVGPEFCFLSELWTEFEPRSGRYEYAGLEGVAVFVRAMRDHGFTERELDLMVKENPARALGLEVQNLRTGEDQGKR